MTATRLFGRVAYLLFGVSLLSAADASRVPSPAIGAWGQRQVLFLKPNCT